METLQHPGSLGFWGKFAQATNLYKHTSRSSQPGWYLDALAQHHQLHIRVDGADLKTWAFDKNTGLWTEGLPLTEAVLEDAAKRREWVSSLIADCRRGRKKALGVVIHVADEFTTAELKPSLQSASLAELREAAVADPMEIIEDSALSPDQQVWRVVPYLSRQGSSVGTTINISRALEPLLADLRGQAGLEDFPLTTHTLSAPLVALTAVPAAVALAPGKPFVTILQYASFTALAFFDENGELRLIRTQHHRGQRRPPNFRRTIATTNASLELHDPDLFVFPLGRDVDESLAADLRATFPSCRIETLAAPAAGLPGWAPEPSIAVSRPPDEPAFSQTFEVLRKDGWALQDFLPEAKEQLELYPSRSEMRLIRFSRFARVAILLGTLGILGSFGWSLVSTIRRPEWAFNPQDSAAAKQRLAALNVEKNEAARFDNLLADRSKSWSNLEFIARLVPENSGVRLKDVVHTVRPDTKAGQAKAGFVKEWRFNGLARAEGENHLQTLNTREGLSAVFQTIADLTGDPSFVPNLPTRTLVTNVRTRENNMFRQRPAEEIVDLDDSTYPLLFELTITQRFEATDPLALNVAKPQSPGGSKSKSKAKPKNKAS